MIQVAGSVNDTMNFNRPSADYIENKVGFNSQYPVSVGAKFGMARYSAKEGMSLQQTNSFVKLF